MSALVDKSGNTLGREAGEQQAIDYLLNQATKGDLRPIIEGYVYDLTDDELMEWLVDPDTGDFVE